MESTEPPDVGFSGSETGEVTETGKKSFPFPAENVGRMYIF